MESLELESHVWFVAQLTVYFGARLAIFNFFAGCCYCSRDVVLLLLRMLLFSKPYPNSRSHSGSLGVYGERMYSMTVWIETHTIVQRLLRCEILWVTSAISVHTMAINEGILDIVRDTILSSDHVEPPSSLV